MKYSKSILKVSMTLVILLLLMLVLSAKTALADSTGAYFPTSGTNEPGIGTAVWQNTGNITADDANYATVELNKGYHISNYLRGSAYGFNLPVDATITGIEVVIDRMNSASTPPPVLDNVVSLVKGGTRIVENKAMITAWPTTFETATYGGPGDLWGTTWNAAEIGTIGVDLSIQTGNNTSLKTAYVDYITITVYYTLISTTTTVDCGAGSPSTTFGTSINCVATVTGILGGASPTGTVSWSTSGSGTFVTSPCTLSPLSAGIASCDVDYTPTAVGTLPHTITATYDGFESFYGSSGNQDVAVSKADATVSVTGYDLTYDGDPHTATGSATGVNGEDLIILLDLSGTTHTNAGNYPTDPWVFAGNENYNEASGTVLDNIAKANPNCAVVPYNVPYDKNPHTATGSCKGAKDETLDGLDLTGTTHTSIGIYTDPWTFTDVTGNYNDTAGSVNDVITKRAITIAADAKSRGFGQPDPVLTFQITVGSLLAGDDFTGSLARQPGEWPGTYAILLGTLSLPDYYEITYLGANFTITGSRILIPWVNR